MTDKRLKQVFLDGQLITGSTADLYIYLKESGYSSSDIKALTGRHPQTSRGLIYRGYKSPRVRRKKYLAYKKQQLSQLIYDRQCNFVEIVFGDSYLPGDKFTEWLIKLFQNNFKQEVKDKFYQFYVLGKPINIFRHRIQRHLKLKQIKYKLEKYHNYFVINSIIIRKD